MQKEVVFVVKSVMIVVVGVLFANYLERKALFSKVSTPSKMA
jgi:hypothetical protein